MAIAGYQSRRGLDFDVGCPFCGYDLRAHRGKIVQCPECGRSFRFKQLASFARYAKVGETPEFNLMAMAAWWLALSPVFIGLAWVTTDGLDLSDAIRFAVPASLIGFCWLCLVGASVRRQKFPRAWLMFAKVHVCVIAMTYAAGVALLMMVYGLLSVFTWGSWASVTPMVVALIALAVALGGWAGYRSERRAAYRAFLLREIQVSPGESN